jgi:GNAT superfamily N-acetyltransferase
MLFRNLCIKYKYSHSLQFLFDALSKFGVRISPFYIFEESICSQSPPIQFKGFEEYEIGFWGPREIQSMALIPGRRYSEKNLLDRLRDGHLCFGLKKNGEPVAFSWCNLKEFKYKWDRFSLKADEAYMFDMYTRIDHRGKGIAPYLRYHFYRELEKIGRTKLYSMSDFFNTPAVNFKKKLNARKIKLNLYVEFFGRWNIYFTIKNYSGSQNQRDRSL